MTKSAEHLKPEPVSADAIQGMALGSVNAATDAYMSVWRSTAKMEAEMLRFVTSRLEKDFAFPVRLMNCRKPDEVLEAQLEFARTFFNDYAEEGQRLGAFLRDSGKTAARAD
jgi:hypothetical protein